MTVEYRVNGKFIREDYYVDHCESCDRRIQDGTVYCEPCLAYIRGAQFFKAALLDNELNY